MKAAEGSLRRAARHMASPHYYHGRSSSRLFFNNFLQLIGFFFSESPRRNSLASLSQMKNSRVGRTALVLGSGPSLNKLNADVLHEWVDDVLVVNGFDQLAISEKIKPTFWGLSDPAHFVDSEDKLTFRHKELFNFISKSEATLVLPHWANNYSVFDRYKKLYFDDRELTFFNRSINPLKPRGYGSTTVYKILAFAAFLNYDRIYILGIDNTGFCNYRGSLDNRIIDLGLETASKKASSESDFLQAYEAVFSSGLAGRMQSYAHLFGDLFLFPKDKIINLDSSSLIDAFEKLEDHPLINPNFHPGKSND